MIDRDAFSETYAEAKAHLVGTALHGPNDPLWRRLGRSIYILGHLGDAWLAGCFEKRVGHIRSLHLKYHIGEALLCLAMNDLLWNSECDSIIRAASALERSANNDPVVRAYVGALNTKEGFQEACYDEVSSSLELLVTNTTGEYFQAEFWRRAHGVEAFAEIVRPDQCAATILRVWAQEDSADYGSHGEQGYRLVQSSILKAAFRSCDSYGRQEIYKPLLEMVFLSRRGDQNEWVCKHLQDLLLKWYSGIEDLDWLKSWQDADQLGGPSIRRAIKNVVFLRE